MDVDLPDGLSASQSGTTSLPIHDINALAEAEEFDAQGTRGYEFIVSDGETTVANVVYAYLPRGQAGYIAWTEVEEPYQRQGIAQDLRESAMGHLIDMGAHKIYTWPTTVAGKQLVEASGGFEPVQNDQLPGWYVYE